MRILMVVLACTAGLSAQVAGTDAVGTVKQFEQNLENALELRRVVSLTPCPHLSLIAPMRATMAPIRFCAFPLLEVRPDPAFRSNMPTIKPAPNVRFFILQVSPPARSRGERENDEQENK
jgi:hypothetical protein